MKEIITWEPGQTLPESFLELPYLLYRHDPLWLPEFETETAAAFSNSNIYFKENRAKIWVAPGKARLAAFFQPEQLVNGEKAVFFGFWESANIQEINKQLFAEAEKWARELGAVSVYGPINFNTYNKYRIRLNLRSNEGCFIGEPYNPVYYHNLLLSCGYQLNNLYQSQYIPENLVETVYQAKEKTLEQMKKFPFRVEYLQPDYWLNRLPDFYALAQIIFGQNFAYTPVTLGQFKEKYGNRFTKQFCPNLSTVVLDVNDKILGFSLGYPDYSQLCRQGTANPVHPSDLSFKKHYPLLEKPTYLMRTVGVHPAYRQQEIFTAIGSYTMFRFREFYHSAMACTMRADNFSTRFFGPYDVQRREYGLFTKRLV